MTHKIKHHKHKATFLSFYVNMHCDFCYSLTDIPHVEFLKVFQGCIWFKSLCECNKVVSAILLFYNFFLFFFFLNISRGLISLIKLKSLDFRLELNSKLCVFTCSFQIYRKPKCQLRLCCIHKTKWYLHEF